MKHRHRASASTLEVFPPAIDREHVTSWFLKNRLAFVNKLRANLKCSHADAEDFLGDGLLALIQSLELGTFQNGNVEAFLWQCARHRFLDQCRRRGRREIVNEGGETPAYSEAADPAPAQDRHFIGREQIAIATAALTAGEKEMLLAIDHNGGTVARIAAAYGITPDVLYRRMYRIRRKCQHAIYLSQPGVRR